MVNFFTNPTRLGVLMMLLFMTILVFICDLATSQKTENLNDKLSSAFKILLSSNKQNPMYKNDQKRNEYIGEIIIAAKKYELDPFLIAAMSYYETSGGLPKVGPQGELGPIQVHPKTAKSYKCKTQTRQDLILCGAKILRDEADKCNSIYGALAAYGSRTGSCIPKSKNLKRYINKRIKLSYTLKELAKYTVN